MFRSGQCETNLISEFRTYRNTKFSTPEIPDFNGTETGLSVSENWSETDTETTENVPVFRKFSEIFEIPVHFWTFPKIPV